MWDLNRAKIKFISSHRIKALSPASYSFSYLTTPRNRTALFLKHRSGSGCGRLQPCQEFHCPCIAQSHGCIKRTIHPLGGGSLHVSASSKICSAFSSPNARRKPSKEQAAGECYLIAETYQRQISSWCWLSCHPAMC